MRRRGSRFLPYSYYSTCFYGSSWAVPIYECGDGSVCVRVRQAYEKAPRRALSTKRRAPRPANHVTGEGICLEGEPITSHRREYTLNAECGMFRQSTYMLDTYVADTRQSWNTEKGSLGQFVRRRNPTGVER
eukprot:926395-Prorocentrum_minimum.AAC.9